MMLTWKYTLPAFLVPFAFTLDTRGLGLLLQGSVWDIFMSGITAAIGVAGLAMGVGAWALGRKALWPRLLAGSGGLLLFHPAPAADVAGILMLLAALALARLRT